MRCAPHNSRMFRRLIFAWWVAFACVGCANQDYFVQPKGNGEIATIQGSFHRFGMSNWEAVLVDQVDGQKIKPPFPGTYQQTAEQVLAIPITPLTISVAVYVRPIPGPIMIRGIGEILFKAVPGNQYMVTGEVHREDGEAVVWIVNAETEKPVSETAVLELVGIDVSSPVPIIGPKWQ